MIFILLKCVSGHNFHQIGLICQKNPPKTNKVSMYTLICTFFFFERQSGPHLEAEGGISLPAPEYQFESYMHPLLTCMISNALNLLSYKNYWTQIK